jgi:carbon storage regulator
MLVLSRKVGQQIVLPGCGVTISIVEVHGKRVRVGVIAPSTTPVHRSEYWERIHPNQESLLPNDKLPPGDGARPLNAALVPNPLALSPAPQP